MKTLIIVFTLVCFIVPKADALSLKEKKRWREATKNVGKYVKEMNKECGFEVKFEFDKKSFKGWDWEKKRVEYYCGKMLNKIGNTCEESEEGRKAIQKQVKKIVCFQRPTGKPEKHSLKKGILSYSVEKKFINRHDYEWLRKNIKPASGATLKEAEDWASYNKRLNRKMNELNSSCETDITLKPDRKSFMGRKAEWGNASYCDIAIYAIRNSCKEETFRTGKASKIKTLACKGTKNDKSAFGAYKSGIVTFHVGKSRAIYGNINQDWLKKNVH